MSHTGNTEYVLSFTGGVFDGLIACVVSSSRITNFFPGEAIRDNRVLEPRVLSLCLNFCGFVNLHTCGDLADLVLTFACYIIFFCFFSFFI